MRPTKSFCLLLVAVAIGGLIACGTYETPGLQSELDIESALVYARYIEPTDAESSWRTIPWLPTFAEGLRTSGRDGRPLLFWAMNGHPLGCT